MSAYFGPIEGQTLKNTYFRQVLFTGQHCQLVVMCLQPGEEIGNEVHPAVDQFFRIEQGEAKFVLNGVGGARRPQERGGHRARRHLPQCHQHVEDDQVEALHGLFAAQPPGRDRPQDQGRGRGRGEARTLRGVPRGCRREPTGRPGRTRRR